MNPLTEIQLDAHGKLRHFLTLDGLPLPIIQHILDTAEHFSSNASGNRKKFDTLTGKTIANLFFETSTRTRNSFELAEKRLSADIMNFDYSKSAAAGKGETLRDTLKNLEAMQVDMFVVRHGQSGAAHFIASKAAPGVSVINAGDGSHAHPTQALLDVFTIRRYKPDFSRLCVTIVGDIRHSRVARSQIQALTTLGAGEIRVIGPRTLLPDHPKALGVHAFNHIRDGLRGVDVIIMLRLQNERMTSALLPSEQEYFRLFGLTASLLELTNPDPLIMHPGPINRGVEMDSQVADGKHSVILEQVTHGLAIRMAVLSIAMGVTLPDKPAPNDARPEPTP